MVLQRSSAETESLHNLTRFNEELELTGGIAINWSNVSPLVWEFTLRDLSSEGVSTAFLTGSMMSSLQKKLLSDSSEKAFLSSIKNLIGLPGNRLQIITEFPDPLLPQKLSQVNLVDLDPKIQKALKMIASEAGAPKIIIVESDREKLMEGIEKGLFDTLDNPEPALWPILTQHGYQIIPTLNTESLALLVNRKRSFFEKPESVVQLRKLLQTPQLLQASYLQYGQFASQFAPPGVIGFNPKIQAPQEREADREAITASLGPASRPFRLLFPEEERPVAEILGGELIRLGYEVEPLAVANENFRQELLEAAESNIDLTILPLNFELGDVGPFLDTFIESSSAYNHGYNNATVDELIRQSRTELNSFRRLEQLQKIMRIITLEDPAGIPLLFKKSFIAKKKSS